MSQRNIAVQNHMNFINSHLFEISERLYKPCNFKIASVTSEAEGKAYGASDFLLNQREIKFRIAKKTPTKTGQFVTLWTRGIERVTRPYNCSDSIDLVVISTRHNDFFGQFIFPKAALIKQKILSDELQEGKRGFRVYAPWDSGLNNQAQKNQNWQIEYFLEFPKKGVIDYARAQYLYCAS